MCLCIIWLCIILEISFPKYNYFTLNMSLTVVACNFLIILERTTLRQDCMQDSSHCQARGQSFRRGRREETNLNKRQPSAKGRIPKLRSLLKGAHGRGWTSRVWLGLWFLREDKSKSWAMVARKWVMRESSFLLLGLPGRSVKWGLRERRGRGFAVCIEEMGGWGSFSLDSLKPSPRRGAFQKLCTKWKPRKS